ncbi:hypothetical protein JC606_21580 [Vibrio sp. IB15]|uniref:hypothetical protein n=1 Tax=Vibrio sp. IB15 TaxID=2779368 RepID=UPI0018E74B1E|nr:hypothetical protein [Vibrio sp. IB15]MBJ2148931.1 hypothetical protein [Vibrio sp. IB15]
MKKLRHLAILATVTALSSPAFADDSTANAAITAAVDSGKAMVATTTAGVIAIAALGFGLGMVVSWLRK